MTFENIVYQTELFPRIGADFESECDFIYGKVGNVKVRLIAQKKIVDFAVEWFHKRIEDDRLDSRE